MRRPEKKELPKELRALVRQTLTVLGDELRKLYGKSSFQEIETLRKSMVELRDQDLSAQLLVLKKWRKVFVAKTPERRTEIAQAFGLFMELTNVCENAYRSFRLSSRDLKFGGAEEIIFVVTAHPTEARNPATVALFKKVQKLLKTSLKEGFASIETELRFLVSVLIQTPLSPLEKPSPQSEAAHLYRWILDEDLLKALIEQPALQDKVRFRAWAGGDKDGHPGVNESVMRDSLSLSRNEILSFVRSCLDESWKLLHGIDLEWRQELETLQSRVKTLERVSEGDEGRVLRFQADVERLFDRIQSKTKLVVPSLRRLVDLKKIFPMWLVPLEFRESSDVIEAISKAPSLRPGECELDLTIFKMLKTLREICPGSAQRHYVQSWVISMVRDEQDLLYALDVQKKAFQGLVCLPIVPLFETREALENSSEIVKNFLDLAPDYEKHVKEIWKSRYELMLGYSDSAKESGVFASRVLIANSMAQLEALLLKRKLKPVFFHGTGGSVARGGGPIDEQMAWWTPSARKIFKVTVQGEMVARNFASPEHFLRYLSKIDESFNILKSNSLSALKREPQWDALLKKLAATNASFYEEKVSSQFFLEIVSKTTLYPFLHALKMGSRPAKRRDLASVHDLRAIPWVLCWTQLRVLFPEWWGIARAWSSLSKDEQSLFKRQALKDPLTATYLKQLGFSLSKIELAPWLMSLDRAGGEGAFGELAQEFAHEFGATLEFHRKVTQQNNVLWFRPWLFQSIYLRKTMIFPLNILQDIALELGDENLLRQTVTGVASGMLTSG